jgi:hypothetical protein
MDSRSRKSVERSNRYEGEDWPRRAARQVRKTPVPAEALGRALEKARRIGLPNRPWRGWLIQGLVGRN